MMKKTVRRASPWRTAFFLPPALVLLLLGGLSSPVFADRSRRDATDIPPPPPLAIPLEIEVFQGESVSIPLLARGRAAGEAQFLIRSRPRIGSLGAVQQVRPGQASVEYQHGGGPAPAVDEFTFAVQSPGTPVSAPARVQISVRLRPAELLPLEAIDSGEVLVGQQGETFLTLTNTGGEPLRTKLSITEGWTLPGGAEILVRGGEALRVPVRFHPFEDRDYSGSIRFSHDEKSVVVLQGTGLEPLQWNPLSLAIGQEGRGESETAFLELENRTRDELRGRIQGEPGVMVTGEFTIPAGSSLRVPVRPEPGFIAGASGVLRIVHQHGSAEVPFQVYPVPARVLVSPSDTVDFGEIPARQTAERILVFKNEGGLPAAVSLTPPAGIEAGSALDFQLAPGAENEVPLLLQSRRPGAWNGILKIRAAGDEQILKLRAEVLEALGGDNPVFISPGRRERKPVDSGAAASGAGSPGAGQDEPPVLAWNDLQIVSQTPTTVVLEWRTNISSDRVIGMEQRSVGVGGDGGVDIRWEASPHADIYRSGDDAVRATIFALKPGMRLNLRHVVRDDAGELRGVSEMLVVETPLPERGWRIPWGWLLPVVLVGFLVWHIRQRRRAEAAAAEADIRRLEEQR